MRLLALAFYQQAERVALRVERPADFHAVALAGKLGVEGQAVNLPGCNLEFRHIQAGQFLGRYVAGEFRKRLAFQARSLAAGDLPKGFIGKDAFPLVVLVKVEVGTLVEQ